MLLTVELRGNDGIKVCEAWAILDRLPATPEQFLAGDLAPLAYAVFKTVTGPANKGDKE